MEPLRLYTSRAKQVLLLLGCLVLTGGAAWMLTQGRTARENLYLVAGIALFGAGLVYLLVALVRRRPALVVDAEGITDASNLAAGGRIAWSEIRGVRIAKLGERRVLAVDLIDADRAIARVPTPRRPLLTANNALTGTPVNIPEASLPIELEQVIAEMAGRNPNLRVGPAQQ